MELEQIDMVAAEPLQAGVERGAHGVADAAALDELELPPARACAVPANTLVVADMFGFHARGVSLRPTVRVELWGYGRRSPFLPWAGLDLWSIKALGNRRAPWFWWAADVMEGAGLKYNVWRAKNQVSAFDPT